MKRRYKKAALLLTAAMLLSLTACGAKEDPKEVFDEAVAKNAALTDLDTNMVMDMDMTMDTYTFGISADMSMQASGMNTESMRYYSDSSMVLDLTELLGTNQAIDTITFYEDGYCYTEALGQKIKYAMDLDSMMATLQQSMPSSELQSDLMAEITLEEKDGVRVLSFTADPEKYSEQVTEMLGVLGDQMASLGVQESAMTISELSGTYTLNDEGYYTAADMTMAFDMDMEGSPVTVSCNIQMTINNPGEPVEVVLPDTSEYQEVSLTQ